MHAYSPKRPGTGTTRKADSRTAAPRAWGWPEPARHLLAALSIVTAIGLGTASLTTLGPGESLAPPPRLELDLNTAPAHVLGSLPQVGPALVDRIVAIRRHRPLTSLADARARVPGLGRATVAQIAPHLAANLPRTLAGDTTTNPPKTRRPTTNRKRRLETALATSNNDR